MLGHWYGLLQLSGESPLPSAGASFPEMPDSKCGGRLGGAWHRPGILIDVAKSSASAKKPRGKSKDLEWLLKPL